MTTRNVSTSMGRGRTPFPCTPSQKQNLAVYTEELTHLSNPKMAILKASVDVLTGFLANVASSAAVVYLKTTFPTVF